MATVDDVRTASAQFYSALNAALNGDAGPLDGIWSHDAEVTTLHPLGGRQVGWLEVQPVFAQTATVSSKGNVRLEDQLVRVIGDMAYEVGVERGSLTLAGNAVEIAGNRVTNVYVRESGGWKIVHHHTDLSPEMVDIRARLAAR